MKRIKVEEIVTKISARISIIVFFIMAFEIMIMISPFAFFFYSVFNPVFHWLDQFTATRWLTTFFLPHMILPPTLLLKTIRILGSACFIFGFCVFAVCALQVYLGKIFKWGVANKGLYQYIRHPQYLALGIWGIGMSILWPRFIVLATLSIMFVLYYFLAKDEEKRMLNQYGEQYQNYMNSTGMFLPKSIEKYFSFLGRIFPKTSWRYLAVPLPVIILVIGMGFLLREITLHSLAFESKDNITLVSMITEDNVLSTDVLSGILKNNGGVNVGLTGDKDYLGYVMPVDYIMQGMIADTGGEFHLYKKHHTVEMITDWVLHPFQHLRSSPSLHMAKMHNVDPEVARRHHCPLGIDDPDMTCNACDYRRVIIVEIKHDYRRHLSGEKLFSLNATRLPVSFIDINAKTGEIIKVVKVRKATAWEDVPTPGI
jgi:protein-S-isoprenylcysteine O-methyltransferase Ste14